MALILKRASASRPSGEWNDDDYDVLADGGVVGRIFKANAAPGEWNDDQTTFSPTSRCRPGDIKQCLPERDARVEPAMPTIGIVLIRTLAATPGPSTVHQRGLIIPGLSPNKSSAD